MTTNYETLRARLSKFPHARIPTLEQFEALQLRTGKGTGKEGDVCAVQLVREWEGLDAASDAVPATEVQLESWASGAACLRRMLELTDTDASATTGGAVDG